MNNSEVVYVPIKGNSKCIYPVYIPIIIKDKETYRASGSLSSEDYEDTKNNLAGFPALIPIISALAPLAIQGITKLGQHIFKNRKARGYIYPMTNPTGRTRTAGYIPTNPNIKNLKQLQELYDEYD